MDKARRDELLECCSQRDANPYLHPEVALTTEEIRELLNKADRFEDAETLAQGWRNSTDMREVPAVVVATRCAEELEQVLHANHAKWDKPSTGA